jgi:hypothetical protein
MPNIDATLWAHRHERARRWAKSSLDGYPVVPLEEETDARLAAEPRAEPKKPSKPTLGERADDSVAGGAGSAAGHRAVSTLTPSCPGRDGGSKSSLPAWSIRSHIRRFEASA